MTNAIGIAKGKSPRSGEPTAKRSQLSRDRNYQEIDSPRMAANRPPPQETRRSRKGAISLASLVPVAVASALRERGFASTAIMTEWAEIVGPRLAGWSHPLEIRWPRRPGEAAATSPKPISARAKQDHASRAVLVIACPGAFALDVQMASASIIEAVNRRLGFGCVGSIQIHQMPRPEPASPAPSRSLDPALVTRIEAGLGDIDAEDLRRSLAKLGAEIATRSAK
jgi:hypothetical protein